MGAYPGYICMETSYYIDPLKLDTLALTWEWVLTRDTTVYDTVVAQQYNNIIEDCIPCGHSIFHIFNTLCNKPKTILIQFAYT